MLQDIHIFSNVVIEEFPSNIAKSIWIYCRATTSICYATCNEKSIFSLLFNTLHPSWFWKLLTTILCGGARLSPYKYARKNIFINLTFRSLILSIIGNKNIFCKLFFLLTQSITYLDSHKIWIWAIPFTITILNSVLKHSNLHNCWCLPLV